MGIAVLLTLATHAVRLLGLGLHAEPRVAVRAHLLHRHPGGRRHRGGGEHPPPARARSGAAHRHHPRRGGRGRRPDHPRHLHRDRGAAADGLRQRPDGPLHEPDPDQRQHGHADLARHRLHGDAVARAQVLPAGASRCGGLRQAGAAVAAHPRALHRFGAQPPAAAVRHPRPDPRLGVARRREAGGAEDAALRQQVGVPGGGGHARGHAAGSDRGGAARAWRAPRDASPRSPTTRPTRGSPRRSTSTAWCASTTCARCPSRATCR